MKKIHILGSGCAKCDDLMKVTQAATAELDLDCEIEKVSDFLRFADFGVMITPALVVDGEVKVSGRVPSLDDMQKLLTDS